MNDCKEIVFEKINDDYGYGKYGEFEVIIDLKTGYINATKLCKYGGKRFRDWLKNSESKNLVQEFTNCLGIPKEKLLQTRTGVPNNLRGTYVHPDLIPHIASWVSPRFCIMISRIINDWRKQHQDNELYYWREMGDCIMNHPSVENDSEEQVWRDRIALEENGQVEVVVESGIVDVLTETKVIEVKQVNHWKHALGQVLSYSQDFSNNTREKWIYLFGVVDSEKKHIIYNHCKYIGVEVKFLI